MKKTFSKAMNILLFVAIIYMVYQKFVVNQPAKNIELDGLVVKKLDGSIINVSELQGKPLLINFWASWCGPCLIEMPSIEKLYQSVKHEDVNILIVSTEDETAVNKYIAKHNYEMPYYILVDQGEIPIKTIPLTYLINKDGGVEKVVNRPINWNSKKIKKQLRALMNENKLK